MGEKYVYGMGSLFFIFYFKLILKKKSMMIKILK
jgi:hypothetical protein